MRINLYHHEIPFMADRVEHVEKVADTGNTFHGIRFYTEAPLEHEPGDDDSAAITLWVPWTKKNGHDTSDLLKVGEAIIRFCHKVSEDKDAVIERLRNWAAERRAPLYPVTIVATRYQGTYEGGSWAAFNSFSHHLPAGHDASDIECMEFWRSPEAERIGRGYNPATALADLVERVKVHGESKRMRGQ